MQAIIFNKTIHLNSLGDTKSLANAIAKYIKANGNHIFFEGSIGIGKSTIIEYILNEFDFTYQNSPTYTMAKEYINSNAQIVHIDLYQSASIDLMEYAIYWTALIEWSSQCNNINQIFPNNIQVNLSWKAKFALHTLRKIMNNKFTIII